VASDADVVKWERLAVADRGVAKSDRQLGNQVGPTLNDRTVSFADEAQTRDVRRQRKRRGSNTNATKTALRENITCTSTEVLARNDR